MNGVSVALLRLHKYIFWTEVMLFRVQHISRMFSFVAISLNDTRDTHTHFGCRSSCAKTTHSVTIHIWISIEFSLCKTIKCSTLYKYIYYIALLVHSVRIYFEHASAPLELGFNVRLWIYTRYKKRNPIKCNTVDYIANFFFPPSHLEFARTTLKSTAVFSARSPVFSDSPSCRHHARQIE